MNISILGMQLVRKWEGFKPKMYLDSVNRPTVGIGTLIDTDSEKYLLTATITESMAYELLKKDMNKFEDIIDNNVKVKLNQNQFDALCCFVYNVGGGNFKSSTLLKKLNLGDYIGASNQLLVWNKAGGKVLSGLTSRRKDEKLLFDKI